MAVVTVLLFSLTLSIKELDAVACTAKVQEQIQLCAETTFVKTRNISIQMQHNPQHPGVPNWHMFYNMCCQMCGFFSSNSAWKCFGFNFWKDSKSCFLTLEQPSSFFYHSSCIFAMSDEYKLNKPCKDISTYIYNGSTVPDYKTPTCPIYNGYPAFNITKFKPTPMNLALGRPVYVSSYYSNFYSHRCNLVDGSRFSNLNAAPGCFATMDTVNGPNWVVIDLQDLYSISSVTITNRMDAFTTRSDFLYCGLLQTFTPGSSIIRGKYPLCGQYSGLALNKETLNVICEFTRIGRYVVIQGIRTVVNLNFCEVEVAGNFIDCSNTFVYFTGSTYPDKLSFSCLLSYGYPNISNPVTVNLALGRPVFSSSLLNQTGNSFCNAVDGDANGNFTEGHCISTNINSSTTEWVMVDLQNSYKVTKIIISNRFHSLDETLNNLDVYVLPYYTTTPPASFLCNTTGSMSSIYIAKLKVICSPTLAAGRFVSLVKYNGMNFCELEVFGV